MVTKWKQVQKGLKCEVASVTKARAASMVSKARKVSLAEARRIIEAAEKRYDDSIDLKSGDQFEDYILTKREPWQHCVDTRSYLKHLPAAASSSGSSKVKDLKEKATARIKSVREKADKKTLIVGGASGVVGFLIGLILGGAKK